MRTVDRIELPSTSARMICALSAVLSLFILTTMREACDNSLSQPTVGENRKRDRAGGHGPARLSDDQSGELAAAALRSRRSCSCLSREYSFWLISPLIRRPSGLSTVGLALRI